MALDCGENFAGICTENGSCQICDEDSERLNATGTACECDPNKALSCSDNDGNTWCCGKDLICDVENKSCKDGAGTCQYTFSQQTYTRSSDCSYIISPQKQIRSASCHYTIRNRVLEGNIHVVDMNEIQGCPSDEFCLINYFDKECSSSIGRGNVGASATEDVYGVCSKRTTNTTTCDISSASTDFIEEIQGCPSDQYCLINYLDEGCSSTINNGNVGAGQPEQVYGVCLKRTEYDTTCQITKIADNFLKEKRGCPNGQYCYLKWEGTDCSKTITRDNITGDLFGACLDRTSTNAQCPIK